MSKKETNEKQGQSKKLNDMAIGESFVGYLKGFMKAKNSLTPDVENPIFVTKDGTEVLFWAAGSLRYIRERMAEKGVSEGVLTKITRTAKPASSKTRQKFYADIAFNKNDVKAISELGGASRTSGVDSEGFEF